MKARTKWPLITTGIILIFFGLANIRWSFVPYATGGSTGYQLQCSSLIIGSQCHGFVMRSGGGMCIYDVSFYTLSNIQKSTSSDEYPSLYLPLTTCDQTTEVLTPVVDVTIARTLSVAVSVIGVVLIGVSLFKRKASKE